MFHFRRDSTTYSESFLCFSWLLHFIRQNRWSMSVVTKVWKSAVYLVPHTLIDQGAIWNSEKDAAFWSVQNREIFRFTSEIRNHVVPNSLQNVANLQFTARCRKRSFQICGKFSKGITWFSGSWTKIITEFQEKSWCSTPQDSVHIADLQDRRKCKHSEIISQNGSPAFLKSMPSILLSFSDMCIFNCCTNEMKRHLTAVWRRALGMHTWITGLLDSKVPARLQRKDTVFTILPRRHCPHNSSAKKRLSSRFFRQKDTVLTILPKRDCPHDSSKKTLSSRFFRYILIHHKHPTLRLLAVFHNSQSEGFYVETTSRSSCLTSTIWSLCTATQRRQKGALTSSWVLKITTFECRDTETEFKSPSYPLSAALSLSLLIPTPSACNTSKL